MIIYRISTIHKLIFKISIFLVISIFLFSLFPEFNKVFSFAFEVFDKRFGNDNSTGALMEMWRNTEIGLKTFLIGDGLYTNNNGSYYKHTDIGYHRNILFGGLGFFILLLLYQIYIVSKPLLQYSNKINLNILLFILILLGYILIIHFKGEVIGISEIFLIVLYLYFIPYLKLKNNENITYNK